VRASMDVAQPPSLVTRSDDHSPADWLRLDTGDSTFDWRDHPESGPTFIGALAAANPTVEARTPRTMFDDDRLRAPEAGSI
jgi:hypothetical protein